jgi:hypothetical protein
MQAYLQVIPSILAVFSALVALVVAQLFRDNIIAKVFLVVAAVLCGAGAIAATIVNQNRIIAADLAATERRKEIREQLGAFIFEGLAIMKNCTDNSKPAPVAQTDAWLSRVSIFLEGRLGHSYVARIADPAGVPPNITCNGANSDYNNLVRLIYGVNFHLEQFSGESNF